MLSCSVKADDFSEKQVNFDFYIFGNGLDRLS